MGLSGSSIPWGYYLRDYKKGEQLYKALDGNNLRVVGTTYRSGQAQKAASLRGNGNVVWLVPEPANPVDPNAIACIVSQKAGRKSKHIRIGYIPRDIAERLKRVWVYTNGVPDIISGTLNAAYEISSGRIYGRDWKNIPVGGLSTE